MRLVKPSVEWLQQEPTLEGAKRMVEIGGKTCYKADHLIDKYSYKKFYERMLGNKHLSTLEHGTIYLKMGINDGGRIFIVNHFSRVTTHGSYLYITTNLRVIEENGLYEYLEFICEPTEYHDKRYTFRIITSRIISQQFTRHRVMSPSQESQRYCNYSKGKFNNEVQFIYPVWYKDCSQRAIDLYTKHMISTEKTYFELIKEGLPAEDARDALLNGVKTEFAYTGFESDFLGNFHELRSNRSAQELIRIQEKEIFDIINNNKI